MIAVVQRRLYIRSISLKYQGSDGSINGVCFLVRDSHPDGSIEL